MFPTERDTPALSVLARAVSVLDAFSPDDTAVTVSELGRRTGLAKSTVHRLAVELCRLGLLEQTPRGLRLGLHLFELGQLVPRQRDLREAALPLMEDLREVTRSTVHLAVRDGVEVVYIEILGSKAYPGLPSRVGGRMPAHATGVGKAILAFSPPEVPAERIKSGLAPCSPFTVVAPGALLRELENVRRTGIAYDREESGVGTVCVAAPVLDTGGLAIAALSATGRSTQLDIERMGPAVRTAALALGRQLAAKGRGPGGTRPVPRTGSA
ncbi:IclR family transcriptional regulator [Streptomyces sp. GC420]|uniref:IclR family transcriptional regulator n=1 Tax=Streptomyces sp. GC420 TaxID=2697568 RepID=UPI001414E660|nr:IclR family transcriptional regulator [Streptomyces sp. GC420]NBM16134.1 helix-turn-helix domain-containing protein [Streptomyces sp. GC420]